MIICPNCCDSELLNDVCPKCGYKVGSETPPVHTLPYGTILQNRYFIGRVLGEGGFGITYLGYDTRSKEKIAVKEYYPAGFVSREKSNETHTVHTFSGDKEEFFEKGMTRFLKEAERLSKFVNSPGVVSVRDVFSDNKTAYIVMEFIEGTSLSNILKNVGKISEKSSLEMLIPIIETLSKMHGAGIIHRDIAPDNIMVKPDGTAKLIDFGAAIESTVGGAGDNKATVALVKHGYAADETYDSNHSRQGAWTDVYSMAAVMYRMLTGTVPTDAMDRLRGTALPEITTPVSDRVKNAVYHGMAVLAKDRIRTMDQLKTELLPLPVPVAPTPVPVPAPAPVIKPEKPKKPKKPLKEILKPIIIAVSVIAVLGIAGLLIIPPISQNIRLNEINEQIADGFYSNAYNMLIALPENDKTIPFYDYLYREWTYSLMSEGDFKRAYKVVNGKKYAEKYVGKVVLTDLAVSVYNFSYSDLINSGDVNELEYSMLYITGKTNDLSSYSDGDELVDDIRRAYCISDSEIVSSGDVKIYDDFSINDGGFNYEGLLIYTYANDQYKGLNTLSKWNETTGEKTDKELLGDDIIDVSDFVDANLINELFESGTYENLELISEY